MLDKTPKVSYSVFVIRYFMRGSYMTEINFIVIICSINLILLMWLLSEVRHLRMLLRLALTALKVNWEWKDDK